MIKVSILVPVYNAGKYIKRCCNSLFGQTYNDIEFVFVNDCSADDSLQQIKDVVSAYPERISQLKIINHTVNRGSAASRNTALDNSTGDFIMWVDSDDYLELEAVDKLVQCYKTTGSDYISYSAYRYYKTYREKVVNECYASPQELLCAYLKGDANNYLWNRFVKASIYNDYHLRFIEGLNMGEDMYLLPQLVYHANKLAFLDDILYHYDCTNMDSYTFSFSREKTEQNFQSFYALKEKFAPISNKFFELLEINNLKRLLRYKMALSIYNDNDYYNLIQSRLDLVDSKFYKFVEKRDLPLLLIKNKWLIKVYAKVGGFILRTLKSVKQ